MTSERTQRASAATVSAFGARVTSPAPRDVWRRVYAADPNAVATQSEEWLDCLCAAHGRRDASRLYELADGRRLVLPLAARRIAGARVSEESWPYGWGYGGLLVEGGELTEADCRLVLADLAELPSVRSGVVPMPLTGSLWSAAAPARAHRVPETSLIVDLDGGYDELWSRKFRRQARNSIRKAERFGLEIRREHGGAATLRGVEMFAQLYPRSVDRWAAQRGQPLRLARLLAARRDRPGQVAKVAAALGDRCVVWSATKDGEPVAVHVTLQSPGHHLGWLSAKDEDLARETLATYLLHAATIQDACAAGARYFHMGESELGSPAARFKAYFGAEPVAYQALRFERLPLTRVERGLRSFAAALADRASRRAAAG